jgi:hypothetical protein
MPLSTTSLRRGTGCIPVSQIYPTLREEPALHPPAPSPSGGEGEPDRKSLSRPGLLSIHISQRAVLGPPSPPKSGGTRLQSPPEYTWRYASRGGDLGGHRESILLYKRQPGLGEGLRVRATQMGCTPRQGRARNLNSPDGWRWRASVAAGSWTGPSARQKWQCQNR